MTIKDIKAAIVAVIKQNGGRVYSAETEEGYDKPAFFVSVFPVDRTRVSQAYDELTVSVEVQYEPAVFTDAECIRVADLLSGWFSQPFSCGDRKIKPPELITHSTEENAVLYMTFEITLDVIHSESGTGVIPTMETLHLELGQNEE